MRGTGVPPNNADDWGHCFDLGCYESLNYLRLLQKFLRVRTHAADSSNACLSITKSIRCCFSSNSSVQPSTQYLSSNLSSGQSVPIIARYNFKIYEKNYQSSSTTQDKNCGSSPKKLTTLCQYFDQRVQFAGSDTDYKLLKGWKICSTEAPNRLSFQDSPAFRTAFAARRRKLQFKMNASEEDLEELAVLYRFQSEFDIHDRLLGKGIPAPLSGSPYFSISNSSAIAVYLRMDRSLILGFCNIVDSAQLKSKDGKHLLLDACRNDMRKVKDHATEFGMLPKVPGLNISDAALKIQRTADSRKLYPVVLQRNTEASCIVPLHGVLSNECLNCYEVSLLNLSVHTKVSSLISAKSLLQTALSDPNHTMTQESTAKTKRQRDFSEKMLALLHNNPKSAPDVSSFRYKFAADRFFRIGKYFVLLFVLVIVLLLSSASGPGVSGFIQYKRPSVLACIVCNPFLGTFAPTSTSHL